MTPTSIFSLQDSLEVLEGARLFGFWDWLHVVLQHLVDIRLHVKAITAHRRVYGRLWAERDMESKIWNDWNIFWLKLNDRWEQTSCIQSQDNTGVGWMNENRGAPCANWFQRREILTTVLCYGFKRSSIQWGIPSPNSRVHSFDTCKPPGND